MTELTIMLPPELEDQVREWVDHAIADRLHAPLDPEPWMGVDEAAEYLACKPHRIYDLRSQGRIKFRKDGSRLLTRRSYLDAYLEEQS